MHGLLSGCDTISGNLSLEQTRYTARFTVEYEATSYITNVTRRNHQGISGRCVAVGPGRRGMLYFVHENSTPEQLYRRILQALKAQDPDVVRAEQALSQQPSSTVSIEHFDRFLQARSKHSTVLSKFYGHTITNHDNGYPLFRKIRLSAYFNKQRAGQKLIQDLRVTFGEEAVLVMVNWSAPHARYHEPIRVLVSEGSSRNMGYKSILYTSTRLVRAVQQPQREPPHVPSCSKSTTVSTPAMAAPDRYRFWNRDVVACLNYMHILCGLRRNDMVPHRFRRVAVAPTRRQRRVDDQEQPRTRIRLDDDSPS
ncbi:hypothetical protein BCV72DRAFT_308264 [Rhizopus microsporus var. microsporus]|uniref:Uncharacterized protein n=1 Tax=Rhizopus microsporus var. microsporus TaxID=86635 RepID=A0A1X0QUD7_RHIZD|nr:hypothetical protein BCV72DRAFT_308264 [Rhizopus microsporus var. microsporus]